MSEREAVTVAENGGGAVRKLTAQNRCYLTPREKAAYVFSGFGDKSFDIFKGNNSLFFNQTFLRADPLVLSLSGSVCGVLDTLDNAISGPIIDRTRTRWGRVRPFFIATLPLWFFSAVMPWVLPGGMTNAAVFIWFFFINYVGSIAGSFYNPAYTALLYNLTPNVDERNSLIAVDTYADLAGNWVPSLFDFFVDYMPRTIPTRIIFMCGAFFFIVLASICRVFGFFTMKERIPLATKEEMKEAGLIQSIKAVAFCRPMWVILIKNFFGLGKSVGQQVQKYFWLNCTGKISNGTISGIFTGLPSYFVLPFAAKLSRKMGMRTLAVFSYAFCGVWYMIFYFVGYAPTDSSAVNMIWIVGVLTLAGALNSVQRFCTTAMQGDLFDYVEWKTGIRNEGMMSAAMGYVNLIIGNVSGILAGVIIKSINYVPLLNEYGVVVPQTDPKMLKYIFMVFCLGPGIGRLCKAVTLMFFDVHGKTKDTMLAELAVVRAEKAAKIAAEHGGSAEG